MATSTIVVYKNSSSWKLYANKLFIVEDIDTYLSQFSSSAITYSTMQYIKNDLEIAVNIDINQENAQDILSAPIYCTIVNSTTSAKKFYYFVKNRVWRSEKCVRLELVMDVLNTYKENTDYYFKENCNIIREHKDRFIFTNLTITLNYYLDSFEGSLNVNDDVAFFEESDDIIFTGKIVEVDQYHAIIKIYQHYTRDEIASQIDLNTQYTISKNASNYHTISIDTYSFTGALYRNIDYVPENINPLLQCGNAEGSKILGKSNLRCDWYLLYRNQNDPDESLINPVECYLIPGESLPVSIGAISSGRVVGSTLETGKYYYISVENADGVSLPDGTILNNAHGVAYISGRRVEIFKNEDGSLTITFFARSTTLMGQDPYFETYHVEYITLNRLPEDYVSYSSRPEPAAIIDGWAGLTKSQWTSTSVAVYIDSVDNVDKTDPRNIKLIKVPYVPYDFNITGGKIDLTSSAWQYTTLPQADNTNLLCLKLSDLNTKLKASWKDYTNIPLSSLWMANIISINPSATDLRKDESYESKLFNSEFYSPTFYYDSFQFSFELEKCNIDYYISNFSATLETAISFTMTRTINSKFMFSYDNYKLRLGNENYSNIMPIARNNEEVLYNVPYISYVRTGFNYDVKAKNISNNSNLIGLGLSTISMGASLLMPGLPLKVAGVVASVVSMAMSIKNTIVSYMNNENALKQKLLQAQYQSTSVSGSDDVDLMSEYAENRLKYLVYEPNPIMKDMLFDLFYYCGYASNRMAKPTHNNRINFDYLQGDMSFTNEGNMSQDVLNELINCFKSGITYIHKNTSRSGLAMWDIDQVLENWEKSLGV